MAWGEDADFPEHLSFNSFTKEMDRLTGELTGVEGSITCEATPEELYTENGEEVCKWIVFGMKAAVASAKKCLEAKRGKLTKDPYAKCKPVITVHRDGRMACRWRS